MKWIVGIFGGTSLGVVLWLILGLFVEREMEFGTFISIWAGATVSTFFFHWTATRKQKP